VTLLDIAPPESLSVTASSAVVLSDEAAYADDLVEETMDYTPITSGRLAGPDLIEEEWPAGSGPMGF
jgi:hypothetical protein